MNEQPTGASQEAPLFSEFTAPTKEQWLEQVSKDLKDTPFEKLLWKTLEGITVQPMYFKEDIDGAKHLNYFPGEAPYIRGNAAAGYRTKANVISQDLHWHDRGPVVALLEGG